MTAFNHRFPFLLASFLLYLTGCQLSNPEVDLTADYFRIYDVNTQLSYETNDIQVLDDGGFLIYGTATVDSSQGNSLVYGIPYFLKINQLGIVEWDTTLLTFRDNRDKNKRVDNSRKRLAQIGNAYFFTGYPQDTDDKQIRLLSFDITTKAVTTHYVFDQNTDHIQAIDLVPHPTGVGLYASASKCFNTIFKPDEVGLFYFDNSGSLIWETTLADSYMCKQIFSTTTQSTQPTDIYHDIGYIQTLAGEEYVYVKAADNADIEEREFRILFVSPTTGNVLFSNIFNDVSIVFDQESSDLQTGIPIVVYTDADDSLRLATANYTSGGEEILYPTLEIMPNADEVMFNESEFSSNELQLGTSILIKEARLEGNQLLIYAGTTREGRILIAAFDKKSGRLINKKYFGYNSYYEVGAIAQTNDGGLIIAGHTLTAGRFQQLTVIKISPTRFLELLNVE